MRRLCWVLAQSGALLLLCAPAAALDVSKLWLPKTYRQHYAKLILSAESALQQERCVSLLEGTLDLQQSAVDHPVFRILCRDAVGVSFHLMIDGISRQLIDMDATVEPLLTFEQRLERQRQAEQRALEEQRRVEEQRRLAEQQRLHEQRLAEEAAAAELRQKRDLFHDKCRLALDEATAGLIRVQWLAPWPPEGQAEEAVEPFELAVDFDARDPFGKPLHYRAECSSTVEDDAVEVMIRRRPQDQ